MPNYPLVLLDNDGTLMDFKRAQAHALSALLAHLGVPCGEREQRVYDAINTRVWEELERGEITKPQLQKKRFSILAAELRIQGADPAEMNDIYAGALALCTFAEPGAVELLRELQRECTLAIITNGIEKVQRSRYRRSFLREYVPESHLFISEALGAPKPSVDYFQAVFRRLPGFTPQDAVILGDSLTADILGGCNAGIHTCWYNPKGLPNHTGITPAYEIRSLDAFLPIVLGK